MLRNRAFEWKFFKNKIKRGNLNIAFKGVIGCRGWTIRVAEGARKCDIDKSVSLNAMHRQVQSKTFEGRMIECYKSPDKDVANLVFCI